MKLCTKCKLSKEDSGNFRIKKTKSSDKTFLDSWCNDCNKEYGSIYRRTHKRKKDVRKPWDATRRNIINRVKKNSKDKRWYFDRGIKNFLKLEDVKYLWFRDKAYEMKKPSIDREDPFGHYELTNCRYIELSENSKRAGTHRKEVV